MKYVPPLGATDPNAAYVEGNPLAGIRGSFPTAPGYEGMMREIVNAISLSGLVPADADLTQLWQAMQRATSNTPIVNAVIASGLFQQLAVNPTLYVDDAAGNDGNTGLTSATAFKTHAAALAKGNSAYNFASSQLNLVTAPGTYNLAGPLNVPRGTGTIAIAGGGGNRDTTILSGVGVADAGIVTVNGGSATLANLTIENTGTTGHTFAASGVSAVILGNVSLRRTGSGANGGQAHIFCGGTSSVVINGSGCQAQGNMGYLFYGAGAQIGFNPSAVLTLLGTPHFSGAGLFLDTLGVFYFLSGANISGAATGQRYSIINNGVAQMNGAGYNAIPGDAPGDPASGATSPTGGRYAP